MLVTRKEQKENKITEKKAEKEKIRNNRKEIGKEKKKTEKKKRNRMQKMKNSPNGPAHQREPSGDAPAKRRCGAIYRICPA